MSKQIHSRKPRTSALTWAAIVSVISIFALLIGWWLKGNSGIGLVGTSASLIGLSVTVFTLVLVNDINEKHSRRFKLREFVPRLREHASRARTAYSDRNWLAIRQSFKQIAVVIVEIPVSPNDQEAVKSLVTDINTALDEDNRTLPRLAERLIPRVFGHLETAEMTLRTTEGGFDD